MEVFQNYIYFLKLLPPDNLENTNYSYYLFKRGISIYSHLYRSEMHIPLPTVFLSFLCIFLFKV